MPSTKSTIRDRSAPVDLGPQWRPRTKADHDRINGARETYLSTRGPAARRRRADERSAWTANDRRASVARRLAAGYSLRAGEGAAA